jgi:hypothetical protein
MGGNYVILIACMVLLNQQYSNHTHIYDTLRSCCSTISHWLKGMEGCWNTDRQRSVSQQEKEVTTVCQVRCRRDINITKLVLLHNYNSFVSRQPVFKKPSDPVCFPAFQQQSHYFSTVQTVYTIIRVMAVTEMAYDFFPRQLRYHETRIT